MNSVLKIIINGLTENVSRNLINKDGYKQMSVVTAALPERLSAFWGFECRLGEQSALSDILFEIRRDSSGHDFLSGNVSSTIDVLCEHHLVWKNLRNFTKKWSDPSHPFYADIQNCWLEFDTAGASSADLIETTLETPCVFFGPNTQDKEKLHALIIDATATLEINKSPLQQLDTFINYLPQDAKIFQIGLMPSRAEEGLRILVENISPNELPSWLKSLGWQGNVQTLESLLTSLVSMLKKISIGINLTNNGPGKKIGLECYMDWLENDPAQWLPVLRYAHTLNLCLSNKMNAILSFPGIIKSPLSERKISDGLFYLYLFKKIHHLKFSFDGERASKVKAYLSVSRPEINLNSSMKKDSHSLAETATPMDNSW